jgi:hypothetical protein
MTSTSTFSATLPTKLVNSDTMTPIAGEDNNMTHVDDNEDAYIDFNRLKKRGYSDSEARRITGYNGPVSDMPVQAKASFKSYAQKTKWYLNVPFGDKEEAKKAAEVCGVKLLWDPEYMNPETNKKGCWYVMANVYPGSVYDPAQLRKWQFKSRHLR